MTSRDQSNSDFKTRLRDELAQLEDRFARLEAFLPTDAFAALDQSERLRLRDQVGHMRGYREVLRRRARALGVSGDA